MEQRTITHVQTFQGQIYVLENVPAEVCVQCGEVLLAPQVLGKIQRLVWSGAEPSRTTQMPVYDLAVIK